MTAPRSTASPPNAATFAPASTAATPHSTAQVAPPATHRFLHAFATIGLLQLATMVLLLIRTKALALLLGPANVGAMAVIDKLFATITQTISLSMPFAALRFLPSAWEAGFDSYRSLFARMRNILVALVTFATAGAVLITLLRPEWWGHELRPYQPAILLSALCIPVLAFVPFVQSAIAGRMQQNRSMSFAVLHAAAFAGAAIVGVVVGGLTGLYAAYALLGGLVSLYGLRVATTRPTGKLAAAVKRAPGPPDMRFGLPPAMWRFSVALVVVAFVTPFAALRVQYAVMSEYGASAAGWMQAAVGLSLSVRALLGSAHSVFLTPNVNRGGLVSERMAWANQFQRAFCIVAIAAVPPLLLFPHIFVRLLYSHAFAEGATFAALFIAAEVVTLISGTYQSLILALDHVGFHVLQNVVAQALLVSVAFWLIPHIGIAGAGLGALVAPISLWFSTMLFLRRRHALRAPRTIRSLTGYMLAALLLTGTLGSVIRYVTPGVALAKCIVYVAVLAGGWMLLTDVERRRLRDMLRLRRMAVEAP